MAVAAVPESSHARLREMVAAFVSHQIDWAAGDGVPTGDFEPDSVVIRSADRLRPGRPGLIDVVADVPGRTVHVVFGLRSPGDEVQFLADADDAPLGILEDEDGLAVVFDALADAELATCLLEVVAGDQGALERVRRMSVSSDSVSLTFDERLAFTVFQQLQVGRPDPGLALFLGLDAVGFNHLLAPRAVWRRDGTDLGIVQDYQAGSTGGWSLALTSLRDLYAFGGLPEHAGGDFAAEAHRLGTMTARMHLGLDRAFGRKDGDFASWAAGVESALRPLDPGLFAHDAAFSLLAELRASGGHCAAIRTHGDFHLGRVARTDIGWFVFDFSPGGDPAFTFGTAPDEDPAFHFPLADVADMLWSFHHVAAAAATERDPAGQLGLHALARAWEVRNRRAFLSGYLATPGIGGLVPPERDLVRRLTAAFEFERSVARSVLGV